MADVDRMYDEAVTLKDQGDLEGAVRKLEEVLANDEGHLLSHQALAVYLQKLGRPQEAIQHALKVTELEPNDPFSYTQLSVIYMRCGRIPEAEEAMARSHIVQQQARR
ncbi:MAG: tetratricopeptide repeat protein [Planctomycetes bacterium]|nr:tetratricopeptide repeat protein [Planctomycetota bacterium]